MSKHTPKIKVPPNADAQTLRDLGKRRTFKHTLDSPLINPTWPQVSEKTLEKVLDDVCNMLKSSEKDVLPIIGINHVTRLLEDYVKKSRTEKVEPPLSVVLLCKSDVKPTHLWTHLPVLCHLASFPPKSKPTPIQLIALPPESINRLKEASGIAKAGCIGLPDGKLASSMKTIPSVEIPWIPKSIFTKNHDQIVHQPTKIKTIPTTAPLVTKKQQRKQERLEKK